MHTGVFGYRAAVTEAHSTHRERYQRLRSTLRRLGDVYTDAATEAPVRWLLPHLPLLNEVLERRIHCLRLLWSTRHLRLLRAAELRSLLDHWPTKVLTQTVVDDAHLLRSLLGLPCRKSTHYTLHLLRAHLRLLWSTCRLLRQVAQYVAELTQLPHVVTAITRRLLHLRRSTCHLRRRSLTKTAEILRWSTCHLRLRPLTKTTALRLHLAHEALERPHTAALLPLTKTAEAAALRPLTKTAETAARLPCKWLTHLTSLSAYALPVRA